MYNYLQTIRLIAQSFIAVMVGIAYVLITDRQLYFLKASEAIPADDEDNANLSNGIDFFQYVAG
jgi:hypothetical protein